MKAESSGSAAEFNDATRIGKKEISRRFFNRRIFVESLPVLSGA
jgi:hypothetical protein